jgi:hypothetical protein
MLTPILFSSKIKLRRSERKLRQEDYDLILENAGIEISKKDGGRSLKQRAPDADGSRRKKKKKYRDSDDDELDSQEEDFIATSSEDEEEDEISARDIQMKIRNYVKSSGGLLRAPVFFRSGRALAADRFHLPYCDR